MFRTRLACTPVPQPSLSRKQMSISLRSGWRKRSLLGVLSLGIMGGTSIRIIADGADEQAAVEGLVDLVQSGFAE